MKTFLFSRESNNFTDILQDTGIKSHIRNIITYRNHLILSLQTSDDLNKVIAYVLLKYGEEMVDFNHIIRDRTPKPNVDYIPKKKLVNGKYVDN